MSSVLKKQFTKEILPALMTDLGYTNIHQVPQVTKIVVNIGYGRHVKDKNFIEKAEKILATITGQKPVHNKAKKSISNFKTRKGMNIGVSVTLRGDVMYNFLYKLIHLTLPRVRDFRGVSTKAFDIHGNYTLGLKEHIAFPEIVLEAGDVMHGMEITIVTTAKNKAEGQLLLEKIGMPFKKKN